MLSMCVICLSTGFAIISKQPGQLPQWNSSIAPVLVLLMTAPCNRDGDDRGHGPAALQHIAVTHHMTSSVPVILLATSIQTLSLSPPPSPHPAFCVTARAQPMLAGREKRVLLEVRWQALNHPGGIMEGRGGGLAGSSYHVWSYQVVSSLKIANSSTQPFVPVDL